MGVIEEKFKWDGQLPKPSNMKFSYEDANALSNAFGGGGATLTVAASNALHPERADYQCNDIDDQVDIQEALDALSAGRSHKETVALRGTFYLNDKIDVPAQTVLDLRQAKLVAVVGMPTWTMLLLNADDIEVHGGYLDAITVPVHGIHTAGKRQLIDGTHIEHTGYIDPNTARDGIYMDGTEDSTIKNVWIDDCGRNGLSIIGAKNVVMDNCLFENMDTQDPKAGVDIEPNGPTYVLQDIYFNNCRTRGNFKNGFNVSLGQLDATSQEVRMYFNDCHSYDDNSAAYLSHFHGVQGLVEFNNLRSDYAVASGVTLRNCAYNSIRTVFRNLRIYKPNQLGDTTYPRYYSGFIIYNEAADPNYGNIGNVYVDGLYVDDDAIYGVFMQALNGNIVQDVESRNVSVKNITALNMIRPVLYANSNIKIEQSMSDVEYAITFATYECTDAYCRHFSNQGATGIANVKLYTTTKTILKWPKSTFVVKTAQMLRLSPGATHELIPHGNGVGKYIEANTVGNRVTIEKLNSTQWFISDMVGTWTAQP